MFEQPRKPKNTEICRHIPSKFWHTAVRLSLKGGTGKRGIGETGNRGIGETGNRGIGETGKRGIGETGNRGIGETGMLCGSQLGNSQF